MDKYALNNMATPNIYHYPPFGPGKLSSFRKLFDYLDQPDDFLRQTSGITAFDMGRLLNMGAPSARNYINLLLREDLLTVIGYSDNGSLYNQTAMYGLTSPARAWQWAGEQEARSKAAIKPANARTKTRLATWQLLVRATLNRPMNLLEAEQCLGYTTSGTRKIIRELLALKVIRTERHGKGKNIDTVVVYPGMDMGIITAFLAQTHTSAGVKDSAPIIAKKTHNTLYRARDDEPIYTRPTPNDIPAPDPLLSLFYTGWTPECSNYEEEEEISS